MLTTISDVNILTPRGFSNTSFKFVNILENVRLWSELHGIDIYKTILWPRTTHINIMLLFSYFILKMETAKFSKQQQISPPECCITTKTGNMV
jgi:hypothetical protein